MKFVIQRVKNASCTVENEVIGEIQQGFCVFIGVSNEDTTEIADKMIKKLIGMRIFDDENDKINLSLADVNGGLLLISQFTLYADCRKGNRPSFINAGAADHANHLYEYIINYLANKQATYSLRRNVNDILTDFEYTIFYSLHEEIGHKISNAFSSDKDYHWYSCTTCQKKNDGSSFAIIQSVVCNSSNSSKVKYSLSPSKSPAFTA